MSHCGCCHQGVGQSLAALVGRVLIALLFLLAAGVKIDNWETTVNALKEVGFVLPHLVVGVAIVLEVIGGLLVLFGYHTRFGALLLTIIVVTATVAVHRFWSAAPEHTLVEQENFIRNIFYLGALLLLAAFGPGRYSIDARCHCCSHSCGQ